MQPVSWEIHDRWVQGVGFLLKRTKAKVPIHEQFKMVQDFQSTENNQATFATESDSEDEDPFATPRHRRLKTSAENSSSVRSFSGNRAKPVLGVRQDPPSIVSTPARITTNLWKRSIKRDHSTPK